MGDFLDCELYLSSEEQAMLKFNGQEYSGRPQLGPGNTFRTAPPKNQEEYGAALFDALFPDDDLRRGLVIGRAQATQTDKSLRLRLHIATTAPVELHTLGWEQLLDRGRNTAFARHAGTAFSRYLAVDQNPYEPVELNPPRLLVVLSCPTDLQELNLADINRAKSEEQMKEALRPLTGIHYEVLAGRATPSRIREKLVEGGFHALHVQSHGVVGPGKKVSSLILEKEDGTAEYVDESFFSEIFSGNRDLRMVMLVACHGGVLTNQDPFGGLGRQLVRLGIPAVIAMQETIRMDAAVHFTRHFYKKLAQTGFVDQAVNEARQQLYLQFPPPSGEWAKPVLFMRLRDGLIWKTNHGISTIRARQTENQTVNNKVIRNLTTTLRSGSKEIIPVIGSGINKGFWLSKQEIAKSFLQDEYFTYRDLADHTDLPRITRYLQISDIDPHMALLDILKKDLLARERVEKRKKLEGSTLSEIIEATADRHFDEDSDNPYLILAKLPFQNYLTTNYDSYLCRALKWHNRASVREHCRWQKIQSDQQEHSPPKSAYQKLVGTKETPLVFHLFGSDVEPNQLVLTEDNHLEFLCNLSRDYEWRIPQKLKSRLVLSSLVFLGFNIFDLDFKVVLNGLIRQLGSSPGLSAVLQMDIERDLSATPNHQEILNQFLEAMGSDLKIQVYLGNSRQFLIELRDSCEKGK